MHSPSNRQTGHQRVHAPLGQSAIWVGMLERRSLKTYGHKYNMPLNHHGISLVVEQVPLTTVPPGLGANGVSPGAGRYI